jgi:hypothetical protein
MKRSLQKRQFLQTTTRVVSYLLVLLPAALGFLYVYSFGVNVVYADSWSMVKFFNDLSQGRLSIQELLEPHQEHLVFVPQVVMLLLGTMTEWNSLVEMYLIQACLFVTLIIFLLAFRDSVRSRSAFFPLLVVPISLLVFSLTQQQNLLRGYQIVFVFPEMFGVLALYLLYVLRYQRLRKAVFVGALGSATAATFSQVPGILVWPAGLLQLFISPVEKPTKRVFIALWGLVGLGEWTTWFVSYSSWARDVGREPGNLLSALAYPSAAIEYFLRLLGSPLTGEKGGHLAFATGLSLACLALVTLLLIYKDRRRLGEYSFWVSVLFWSFLILASFVAGNFAQEHYQEVRSRYISFSILAVVGIYGLLATAALGRRLSIRRPSISAILLALLSGIVLLSAGISYPREIEVGRQTKETREAAAFVLSTYKSQPDEALNRCFRQSRKNGPERIRNRAAVLERLGYNVFSESSTASAKNIDPRAGCKHTGTDT